MVTTTAMFGFTDDPSVIECVRDFRNAAVADGWSIEPTYKSESIYRAAKLERDGFTMQILARDNRHRQGKWAFETSIAIWGDDRMCITPPTEYSWAKIKEGTRVCGSCSARDVDTQQAGFANRVCKKCYPAAVKRLEYPGWTN